MKFRVRRFGRPSPSGDEAILEALRTRPDRRPRTLRRAAPRRAPFVVACAWHEDVQGPNVTHTICPRCFQRMIDELDARVGRLE